MSFHVGTTILLITVLMSTVWADCNPLYEFDCGDGECITGYLRCDGFQQCQNGKDEECGPLCYWSPNPIGSLEKTWNPLSYYSHPPKYRNAEYCNKEEICVLRIKKNWTGKLKYTAGCMDTKKCERREREMPGGCDENSINIQEREQCTFCCNTTNCNFSKLQSFQKQL
ncbi:uncharacterized protein LOC144441460 isoform X1 [Glandiceps talaboti]